MSRAKPKKVKAAVKEVECEMCGMPRDPTGESVYVCVNCGGEGFDCCVPGNNAICANCEDDECEHDDEVAY